MCTDKRDRFGNGFCFGEIQLDGPRFSAFASDGFDHYGGPLAPLLVTHEDHPILFGRLTGNGFTDSAAGTCDEYRFHVLSRPACTSASATPTIPFLRVTLKRTM